MSGQARHPAAGRAPDAGDVIITAELDRRPSRPPGHEAENLALGGLAGTMASEPGLVLQNLAEAAMALTRAGSAGISLLEHDGPHGVFRRVAASGAFALHRGATLPAGASPCGEVLARDEVVLMREPGRVYPLCFEAAPAVHEALYAPFHADGRPAGVLWAARHDRDAGFEREDARLLESLARFAAAAHGMARAPQDPRAVDGRSRAELAARLADAELLLGLGDAMRATADPATIERTAMRMLSEHLGLARAYRFEVRRDDHGWAHVVDGAFQRDPAAPGMAGSHALRGFAARMSEGFARGEAVVVDDVEATPALTPAEVDGYRALGVAAFASVPVLRHGEYGAGIGAHDAAPRAWTTRELALVREVGERAWLAV